MCKQEQERETKTSLTCFLFFCFNEAGGFIENLQKGK